MAHRRRLTGQPLLVATGVLLGMGCHPPPSIAPVGNLMAPPQVSVAVCVDVQPAGAKIAIDGVLAVERCTTVTREPGGAIRVTVSADGYVTDNSVVLAEPGLAPVSVVLAVDDGPNLAPVGNLMPPPQLPRK